MSAFTPKVAVFCCSWCSNNGDLASSSVLKKKSHLQVIKTMCSGRVEPAFILSAFGGGADGVVVAGCAPGDCHYGRGNYKTQRRIGVLQKMLAQFGIEPERLRVEMVSSAEASQFESVVSDFVDQVNAMGPLGAARGG